MLARVLAFVMPIVSSSWLTAMQWNPHYQCFVEHYTKATCQTDAFHFLTAQLGHVDFANVVELGQEFKTPDSIGNLGAKCGLDDVNLFYSPQWKQAGSLKHGCMKEGDRPYLVQNFEHISGGHSLIVVGAHFPHSTDWNRLKTAISEVMTESGTTAVLLLADTNVNAGWSNARIMEALGLSGTVTGASTNTSTCCYPGFPNGFAFDRAIAVGMPGDVNTEVLLNTLPNSPDWAKSPEICTSQSSRVSGPPIPPGSSRKMQRRSARSAGGLLTCGPPRVASAQFCRPARRRTATRCSSCRSFQRTRRRKPASRSSRAISSSEPRAGPEHACLVTALPRAVSCSFCSVRHRHGIFIFPGVALPGGRLAPNFG